MYCDLDQTTHNVSAIMDHAVLWTDNMSAMWQMRHVCSSARRHNDVNRREMLTVDLDAHG